MEEHEQVAARRKKLAELRRLGCRAYPNDFQPQDLAAEVAVHHSGSTAATLEAEAPRVSLAGRLMAIRSFGKAAFAQLQDRSGRLQIYVTRADSGEDQFAVFRTAGTYVAPPDRKMTDRSPGSMSSCDSAWSQTSSERPIIGATACSNVPRSMRMFRSTGPASVRSTSGT